LDEAASKIKINDNHTPFSTNLERSRHCLIAVIGNNMSSTGSELERFWATVLAILNLLASLWGPTVIPPVCPIEIWAFATLEACYDVNAVPAVIGTIYADDTCRPTNVMVGQEASNDNNNNNYAAELLLPGNYMAHCTAEGRVRISQSGCVDPTCSPSSLSNPTEDHAAAASHGGAATGHHQRCCVTSSSSSTMLATVLPPW
jgi:hypothetical protein